MVQTIMYKSKLQGYIVQQREDSQYVIITINEYNPFKKYFKIGMLKKYKI